MTLVLFRQISLSFFSILFFISAFSQSEENDSMLLAKAHQALVTLHDQYIDKESGLYNGRQYVVYAHTISEGIPFFLSGDMNNGSVEYDGVTYTNVPLLYDILKNSLITRVPTSNYLIQLNNEKVTAFKILQHQFVKIDKDSVNNLKSGFYEILYNGNSGVYKKQTKILGEDLSTSKLRQYIKDDAAYYVEKYGIFYSVSNKRSLLNVFKDRKKQLQDFIRKNKLNIRQDKDAAISKVAAFYDQFFTNQIN